MSALPKSAQRPRAALYARFSTALQDSRSVDDQLRDCRARALAEGWHVVEVFSDYAISGAVRARPGLDAMLGLARAGGVDIVLSEALDRVSRNLGDIAGIWDELKFAGVRLFTLSEGEVGDIHVGLRGTMNSLFRKDLGDKVRRGQRGRVAVGSTPGGLLYGYRKIHRLDARGEAVRGLREIDPDQAAIVRRIVAEWLAGDSARAIAKRLNREGVAAPRGSVWRESTINGNPERATGILANPLYAGMLTYNRVRMVRDPATRRRVSRPNPREEWQQHAVPELAIVSADDWAQVCERKAAMAGLGLAKTRRPRRLLSGLVKCGECGGQVIVIDADRWGCSNHRTSGTCSAARRISGARLEARVLAGLHDALLAPEAVALYVREYRAAFALRRAEVTAQVADADAREAKALERQRRLVQAIADGGGEFEAIRSALRDVKAEIAAAQAARAEAEAGPVIALHPGIADAYRREVGALAATITGDPAAAREAAPHIRQLIESVTLTPREGAPDNVDIDITGRLTSLLALASNPTLRPAPTPRTMSVVAGEGVGHHRALVRARV